MSTALASARWSQQHTMMPDWTEHYWASRSHPSRQVVIEALRELGPWSTLVELGCNAGPMLAQIHEAFPGAHLEGVEINARAAEACGYNVPTARVHLADLMAWLPHQDANSYDVLVTHYTLAYVAPGDLPAVLSQCLRVAKTLVLAEPLGQERLLYGYPEWSHDYPRELFSQGSVIRVTPVDPPEGNLNAVVSARRRATRGLAA